MVAPPSDPSSAYVDPTMNAAQLIRSLGQASKLTGCREHHEALVALEERATLRDVLELLDDLTDAVDRALPRPSPPAEPEATRERGRRHPRHDEAIALVRSGMRDRAVGERLGLARETVRGIRQAEGIAAAPWTPDDARAAQPTTGWRERIAALHEAGKTNEEIAQATGYTLRTVQQRLHQLGRKANR